MIYTRKRKRPAAFGLHRLAVDFDGVVMQRLRVKHSARLCGEPMPGALDALERLARRWEIVIFSARAGSEKGRLAILAWLNVHKVDGFVTDVTCQKINAVAYIDDRAIRFENWPQVLEIFDA